MVWWRFGAILSDIMHVTGEKSRKGSVYAVPVSYPKCDLPDFELGADHRYLCLHGLDFERLRPSKWE